MISSSRTKACDIDFERQKYIRHLHRLIKLKNGVSSEQIKKNEDEKKLADTIQKMRKIHEYSRSYRWRQNKEVEDKQGQKRCKKIKSIIKEEIERPILNIVSRNQKRNEYEVYKNNMRVFEKITQIKPEQDRNMNGENVKDLFISENDFSQIYGFSKIFEKNRKVMKVDMCRGKNVMKLKIEINERILNQQEKDRDQFYFLEFQMGKNKGRSGYFQLNNIESTDVLLKISKNGFEGNPITARLFKILQNSAGEKEIVRESFRIEPLQMRSELREQKEGSGRKQLKEEEKGKDKDKEENIEKQKSDQDKKGRQDDEKECGQGDDLKQQKKVKKGNKIVRYVMKINTQRMPLIYKERIVSEIKMGDRNLDKNRMIR